MQQAIDIHAPVKQVGTNNSVIVDTQLLLSVLLQENTACGANTVTTRMTPKY